MLILMRADIALLVDHGTSVSLAAHEGKQEEYPRQVYVPVDLALKGVVKCSEMDWDPIFLTCCGPTAARA